MGRLMILRARLEREIYARIALESGVARLFELRPGLSAAEYGRYAQLTVNGDPVIRNVSIIRDTTIVMVYPYEANKSSIGRDLAEVPEQRDALLRARDSDKNVVTGPVNLVQGGQGLVSRMVIHSFGADGIPRYWGQVGVVLDVDPLLKAARTFADSDLRVAIRNVGPDRNDAFAGDASVFDGDPVLTLVSVPDSPWEIAALPVRGWAPYKALFFTTAVVAFVFSLAIASLVASLVAARYRMRELAFFDNLTGLPNRKLFWDRFGYSVSFAGRRQLSIALFVLDLDGFKEVNDVHGHAAGDRLLRAVAERMSAQIRGADTLARLGGDEFVIQAIMERDDGTVARLAERVEDVFAEPFDEPKPGTAVRVSYGHALWPDDGVTGDEVFEKADSRMYAMKRARGHRL